MKVKGYEQQNGHWVRTVTEIPWYRQYYNSWYTIYHYYKNKYLTKN